MASIKKRLVELKKRYGLTTSDLSLLLSTSRTTVFYWETGERKISQSKALLIEKRLDFVEGLKTFFPVPLHVTQYQRKAYLLDAVNALTKKLPRQGTSARR